MTRSVVKAFDRMTLARVADGLAAAVAASLPWSTTATGIFIVLWLIALIPTLRLADIRREVATAAGGLPVLLWFLALAGMLWSDVGLAERLKGMGGYHKLLMIPLLLAQFRRSTHGHWVFLGFLAGSTGVLLFSWLVTFVPVLAPAKMQVPGVPVKDYLTQSGIFQLCTFALAYVAIVAWRSGQQAQALALAGLALLFLVNVLYVASGRTALVLMPAFVLLLGARLFGWRGLVAACVAGAILGGIVWTSSEYMRIRLTTLLEEAAQDPSAEMQTSTGQRLEFYRKSADIILQAPVLGHGTGTIHARFVETSAGRSGAAGVATKNPHQQTFAVAIQLGIVGVAVLWTMWIAQLRLFFGAGMVAWFGLMVVVQNILSSLFNSHVFDFTQGWIYVFGVGVLGGTVLRESLQPKSAATSVGDRAALET